MGPREESGGAELQGSLKWGAGAGESQMLGLRFPLVARALG